MASTDHVHNQRFKKNIADCRVLTCEVKNTVGGGIIIQLIKRGTNNTNNCTYLLQSGTTAE